MGARRAKNMGPWAFVKSRLRHIMKKKVFQITYIMLEEKVLLHLQQVLQSDTPQIKI